MRAIWDHHSSTSFCIPLWELFPLLFYISGLIPVLLSDSFPYSLLSLSSILHPPLYLPHALPNYVLYSPLEEHTDSAETNRKYLKWSSWSEQEPLPKTGSALPRKHSSNSDELFHQPESKGGQTANPLSIVKPSAFTSPISQMHLGSLFIGCHAHATVSFCDNGVRLYQH